MIEVGYSDGLGYGLNKKSKAQRKEARKAKGGSGFKRFIKKNVNLRNTIKAVSLVANVVPFGGIVGKAANLITSKVGQAVMDKVDSGQSFTPQEAQVAQNIIIANETDPNTPNVLTPAQFNTIAPRQTQANAPLYQPKQAVQSYAPAQQEFQDEPQGDVVPVKLSTKNEVTTATPLPTEPKNNTMLYVGGGVGVLLLAYALTHKNK
jgi:hypothetical protein